MMKKTIIAILTILLLASVGFVLSGCGDDDRPPRGTVATVRFYMNDGSDDTFYIQHLQDYRRISSPGNPERDGFVFLGWASSRTGETLFDFEETRITSDTSLFAQWQAIHTLTFHTYDDNYFVHNVYDGERFFVSNVTNPMRDGYRFDMWSHNPQGSTPFNFNVDIRGNLNIHAVWTRAYTLSVLANHGDNALIRELTIFDGDVINPGTGPAPTRQGYSFDRWTTDRAGNNSIQGVRMSGDTNVYAQWIRAHTVTRRLNYVGSGAATEILVNDGTAIGTRITTPTRERYSFTHWSSDPSGNYVVDLNAPVTEDVVLYANWERERQLFTAAAPHFETGGSGTILSVTRPGSTVVGGQSYLNTTVWSVRPHLSGHHVFSLHNLGGNYDLFSGYIGRVDGTAQINNIVTIFGDGIRLTSFTVYALNMPRAFSVDVSGVTQLRIEVRPTNFHWNFPNTAVAMVNTYLQ